MVCVQGSNNHITSDIIIPQLVDDYDNFSISRIMNHSLSVSENNMRHILMR